MTNEETINRLNSMKKYYNDRTEPYYVGLIAYQRSTVIWLSRH